MKDKEARDQINSLKSRVDFWSDTIIRVNQKVLNLEKQYNDSYLDRTLERLHYFVSNEAARTGELVSAMTELTKKFSLLINHLGLEFEDKKAELIIKKKVK